MNNLIANKKTGVIVVGIVLVLLAALVLFFLNKRAHETKKFTMSTAQLSPSEIPSGLPKNLPMDKGSVVLQNYESQSSDSRQQSTRQITNTKAPKDALDFYIDFFKQLGFDGGFSQAASTADGQQVAQMKSKSGDLLTIVATPSMNNQSNVEFTLIQGR